MSPSPRSGADRARLAAKLREIRAATGKSGNQFAKCLSWPQSRVSKIETGAQLPRNEDITAWLRAAEALGEEHVVTELLVRARVESVSFHHAMKDVGGASAYQQSWRDREQQATRIATFHPSLLPGLLQTAAYIRELVALPAGPADLADASPDDIEQMVAVRIERQGLLYDPGKTLTFVLGEAALWIRIGDLETHLGQLDRIQSLLGLRTVDLRILPFTTAMPVAAVNGFEIHDDNFVLMEHLTGEYMLSAPDEIAAYERLFGHYHAAATAGDEATELIQRIARQLADNREP
ncbi:helix-turn-helix domain-containing protein [Amycolatopsis nigrescens]|uniref:helix-turn-helix domain-containing protein n=1 Tax=Amycolatopsis nigrescens TaxID=381445 RepID=UPI000365321D|nr:helix-turn-helix transcriptional regulator [Amycolatopsis nigrescens]